MSKHTSGPWSIHHAYEKQEPYFVESEDGQSWFAFQQYRGAGSVIIAETTSYFGMSSNFKGGWPRVESAAEAKANAYLIAAAPELLEALRQCVSDLGRHAPNSAGSVMARSAIAKANGELA